MDGDLMPNCPQCGNNNQVIRIVYGKPAGGLITEAEQGRVLLGGCCVSNNNFNKYCKKCDKRFEKRSRTFKE